MSVTATVYPLAYRHLGRARVDLLTADVRLLLTTGAYTPADTHEWLSDVQAAETGGAGYTAGGIALTGRSFDLDATGRAVLTCDPVVITGAGVQTRYAVVYAATGTPGASPLLSRVDFGAVLDPAGSDLRFTFTAGVLRLGPVS